MVTCCKLVPANNCKAINLQKVDGKTLCRRPREECFPAVVNVWSSSFSAKMSPQESQNNASPFPTVIQTATACSPTLLSSLVEKLRSKMCGQLRAASAGPLVSPSCLWFSVSWLITQQVDTLTATESMQDGRCDVQVCTTAADVSVELVSPRIARQVEHSPPTTTGGGRARSTRTGGQTCTPWGPRAVFRAGTRLWQGESRTRIWCRGWCSRRQ